MPNTCMHCVCLWVENIVQTTKQPHACSLNRVSVCVCVCVCIHVCWPVISLVPPPPTPTSTPPLIMSTTRSLFLLFTLLPLSGVGSYKRQMDSLSLSLPPPNCSPSPISPKKASHQWIAAYVLTTPQARTVYYMCVFLLVKESVNQHVTWFLFAVCADMPSTQLLRFWIMAFIGWSLFFLCSFASILPWKPSMYCNAFVSVLSFGFFLQAGGWLP